MVLPLMSSVAYDDEAIADPHPKVLKLLYIFHLEHCILNGLSILSNFYLELHDVSTSWGSHESCADGLLGFVHGAHISRLLVVVDNVLVVGIAQEQLRIKFSYLHNLKYIIDG